MFILGVIPSGQQPYCVPAHPPTGTGCGGGSNLILFKIINANKTIAKTIITVESI
jgi:hypothetical protein